jgi:flagellin FlaB
MNREKPNIKCVKCEYRWHTKSKLQMVTCPSCNQKIRNPILKSHFVEKFLQQKRGIIGLEAAIVLIAFVIIAAAFSFMVVNQGLFATERGKTVIQQGIQQASTPLIVDGTILMRTTPSGQNVDVIIIPLRAFGVKFVGVGRNQTLVSLRVGEKAWANVYLGTLHKGHLNATIYNATSSVYDPNWRGDNGNKSQEFDDFVGFQLANQTMDGTPCNIYVNETYNIGYSRGLTTGAVFAIANNNRDEALDVGEAGFLIITLAPDAGAPARTSIYVEIKPEGSATLSIELSIPVSMPPNSYVPLS